ncbi:protein MLP1 homolog [Helianthus annuus]|uniref:protein MLP1 homolog n=1 Tax=Helianthus annuus TaxID=4232 RepID=UPI000B902C04|nr:protein MLP1 homolog [Helianthus annuus]
MRPATIEETYQLAAEINDKRVLVGAFKTSTKSLNQATATPSTDNAASEGPRQQTAQALPTPPVQPLAIQGNPAVPAPVANARTCYTCGDPNHFANICPHRVVKKEPQQQQPPQQQHPQQQQQ